MAASLSGVTLVDDQLLAFDEALHLCEAVHEELEGTGLGPSPSAGARTLA